MPVTGNEADITGKVAVACQRRRTGPDAAAGEGLRERYHEAELAIVEARASRCRSGFSPGALMPRGPQSDAISIAEIEPMLTESLCLLSPANAAGSRAVPFQSLETSNSSFPARPIPFASS